MRASQGKMESGKAQKKCECPSMACTADVHPCVCMKNSALCNATEHECIHRKNPLTKKCRTKLHYCICFYVVDNIHCKADTHDCVCLSNAGNCIAEKHKEYKPKGFTKRAISYKN